MHDEVQRNIVNLKTSMSTYAFYELHRFFFHKGCCFFFFVAELTCTIMQFSLIFFFKLENSTRCSSLIQKKFSGFFSVLDSFPQREN